MTNEFAHLCKHFQVLTSSYLVYVPHFGSCNELSEDFRGDKTSKIVLCLWPFVSQTRFSTVQLHHQGSYQCRMSPLSPVYTLHWCSWRCMKGNLHTHCMFIWKVINGFHRMHCLRVQWVAAFVINLPASDLSWLGAHCH